MQSLPSFLPIPTPTTPRIFIRRASCRRLTSAAPPTPLSCAVRRIKATTERRESGRRRPDEPVLHQEFRLFVRAADQREGALEKLVPRLANAGDTLLDRLPSDRGGFPREHVDLVHRGDDVLVVEAPFLLDLRELFRGGDAHLIRDC